MTAKPAKHYKFIALSGMGWLLDSSILIALSHFNIEIIYANFISSSIAATFVFLMSRKYIFEAKFDTKKTELSTYILYTLLVILSASILIGLVSIELNHLFTDSEFLIDKEIIVFISKIIITPPQLILNFIVSKLIIERKFHA